MKSNYDEKLLKAYEVKVLDKFAKICDEHNIPYFITFGTLLGAIRHKGFIPWDDDIDVHLKPNDYYRFKEIMKDNPYDNVFYQSLETEKYYPLPFAKLRMNNTMVMETKLKDEPIHQGIYIDVFPLIPYPEDDTKRNKLLKKITIINLLLEADLHHKEKYNTYGKVGKILSKLCKIIPRTLRNNIVRSMLKKIINYQGKYHEYIDIIDKIPFPSDCFDETTKVTFGKKLYCAPKDYDKLLTAMYGNYMALPKEEDRKGHSFEAVSFEKGE